MENKNYIIKCDNCKKTIKKNVSFEDSVKGGLCIKCKGYKK